MFQAIYIQDFCITCCKWFSKTKSKNNDKQFITEIPTDSKYKISIMEILENVLPQFEIKIKDNLPTLICTNCIQHLLVSYEFIEMCHNAQKKLREMLDKVEMVNCNGNSDKNQKEFSYPDAYKEFKYEIEEFNIDTLDIEDNKVDSEEQITCDANPSKNMIDDAKSNNTGGLNDSDDGDDWLPQESWLNHLTEEHNSTDGAIISGKRKKRTKKISQPKENENGSFSCQQCVAVLDSVKLWQEHVEEAHAKKAPKRIRKSIKKETHSNTEINESNEKMGLECEKCGKKYTKSAYFEIHVQSHTADPYLCIECGKSFKIKRSFNIHMLRHKGVKNYQCPHCPMSFVCSNGLNNHSKVHINDKAHVCKICGGVYRSAQHLRAHNLYHEGIKKFQCEYCDMRFVTREKQQRHMRTHTGEKPYECKYCDRAFSQSTECIKHLRIHLGANVYQCELCPLRFPLHRDLRTHFASHKNDDKETRCRNLQARKEEEKKLQIRLGSKESV